MKKFYVTTAIDYVNAAPHIGHAFEKVLADALVRWHELKGEKTWFLTGTDENAQKNAQAAKEKGIPVQKFVDKNSKLFVELCKKLNIDYDRFIRTTEKEHKRISQEIFKKVFDKGDIYKGKYEGLYCKGCEAFLTEKDLVDGKCPEHNKEPELISEDSYFFKLSKYENKIIKFVENYIIPKEKKNEILSRLKTEGLKDLCVARTNLDWGIDNPLDKNFKIYVWFDALINYYSGANGNWPADVHVVGKGINWFHSVIWPAMLMSAGIELPKKLLVHGYLNLGGKKISKSLGNVIDPIKLVEKYGTDSLRYSLLRCSVFDDSDYSEDILIERHNNELANKLGNLISRVASLIEKNGVEEFDWKKSKNEVVLSRNIAFTNMNLFTIKWKNLHHMLILCQESVKKHIDNYELDKALNNIFGFIDICNEYIQNKKPWETKNKKVLYELKEAILKISELLSPFIPESAEKIKKQFSAKNIKKGEILFKKVE